MVHAIVYLSSSRVMSDDTELIEIIEQSRKNNAVSDITGALLYCNGSIIQALEGEKEAVHTLFQKIQRDQRHSQVIPLFKGDVQSRSFDKWTMGYSTLNTRNMQELREKLPFIDNPHLPAADGNKVLAILQTFFKNNYRN